MTNLSDSIPSGSTLFLDTAPVIYFVENNPTYFSLLKPIFTKLDEGSIQAVTSPITLAECLYYPYKNNDKNLVKVFYDRLITGQNVRLMSITADIANYSAHLRANYNLGFADAFQVATAIASGSDIFLTNDKQLKRIQLLNVLILNDFSIV